MSSRQLRVVCLGFVAVVLFAGGTGVSPAAGPEGDGPTRIDSCTTIDRPGEYVLTADLRNDSAGDEFGQCLSIRSSDVTIDGNGHVIGGVGRTSQAVFVGTGRSIGLPAPHLSNVTIRDAAVEGHVTYYNVTDAVVRNVTSENGNVAFWGVANGTIRGVRMRGSEEESASPGITVVDSESVTVSNATITDAREGLLLFNDDDLRVENVAVAETEGEGVHLRNVNRSVLTNVTIEDAGTDGFEVEESHATRIVDSAANRSERSGFRVSGGASRFANLTAANNSEWAFVLPRDGGENRVDDLALGTGTRVSFRGTDVGVGPVDSPPEPPDGLAGVGHYVRARSLTAESRLFLNVSYADADVTAAGVPESSLRLYRRGEVFAPFGGSAPTRPDDGSDWTRVEGTNGVNTAENYVYANVSGADYRRPQVEFTDQKSDGRTVTVDSVTAPPGSGGYVVLLVYHRADDPRFDPGDRATVVGNSTYLEPGRTYRNVTVPLRDGYRNDLPVEEQMTAMLIEEGDGDRELDFEYHFPGNDLPYVLDGELVTDGATVSFPPDAPGVVPPTVEFADQTSDGRAVRLNRVVLHEGGFVGVVDENGTLVGVSRYLSPGLYGNVQISLSTSVTGDRTLTAVALKDTNDNQVFDADRAIPGCTMEGPNGTLLADDANVTVERTRMG